jgi:hypothetical protein
LKFDPDSLRFSASRQARAETAANLRQSLQTGGLATSEGELAFRRFPKAGRMFDAELELEAELENLMATLANSDLESEAEGETPQTRLNRDRAVIAAQMARGIRDENKVTDAVFDDRRPEWTGQSLKNAQLSLRQEWMQIRDGIVRPQLKQPGAVQLPITPPAPVPPTPAATHVPASSGQFGYSTFDNIRQYWPDQYQAALAAQAAVQKVIGFLPYYRKIASAAPRVFISEASEGIGNLVFQMTGAEFAALVDDQALRNKVLEMTAGAITSEFAFTEDVIGVLGIGLTLLEIAQGLENDRRLKGFSVEDAEWVRKQQYQFVFGLMAEDLSRRNFGNGYFFSRNSRDLAVELAARFAEFQPVYSQYATYYFLDNDLGQYQGNPPVRQTSLSAG